MRLDNYYTTNRDLRFYYEEVIDWQRLAPLYTDVSNAADSWREILNVAGDYIGLGDHEEARALLHEAIKAMEQIGENVAHPIVLDTYAHLAYDMDQPEQAVRLAAAALHTRRITGASAWPTGERNRTRWLTEARAAIGDAAYSAAWELG
jgi:sugar phosphate isomerase/epimerase